MKASLAGRNILLYDHKFRIVAPDTGQTVLERNFQFMEDFKLNGICAVDGTSVFVFLSDSRTKLWVYDDSTEELLVSKSFTEPIHAFHADEDYLYVCFSFRMAVLRMKNLATVLVQKTFENKGGILKCKNLPDGTRLIVTLGPSGPGELALIRTPRNIDDIPSEMFRNERYLGARVFTARKTHVSAVSISGPGDLLAVTSRKGTTVKIFDISGESPTFVGAFRRGTKKSKIMSLEFQPDGSDAVALVSGNGTLHIFSLRDPDFARQKSPRAAIVHKLGKGELHRQVFWCGGGHIYALSSSNALYHFVLDVRSNSFSLASTLASLF